jgi:hypothetical protein
MIHGIPQRQQLSPTVQISAAGMVRGSCPGLARQRLRIGRLLLEAVHVASGGLSTDHLKDLIIAGCLEEGYVVPKRSASNGSPSIEAQPGLLLTEFGNAVSKCYMKDRAGLFSRTECRAHVLLAVRHMAERPIWNTSEGVLWFQGMLVKRFRHDAPLQRCVLDALQATAWTRHAGNPLPSQEGVNRKIQLKNTVKDLNHGQHCIWFRGDGRGGIRWESKA